MGQSHARRTRVLSVTYWTESFSSERPPGKSANGTVWPSDDGGENFANSPDAFSCSIATMAKVSRSGEDGVVL